MPDHDTRRREVGSGHAAAGAATGAAIGHHDKAKAGKEEGKAVGGGLGVDRAARERTIRARRAAASTIAATIARPSRKLAFDTFGTRFFGPPG